MRTVEKAQYIAMTTPEQWDGNCLPVARVRSDDNQVIGWAYIFNKWMPSGDSDFPEVAIVFGKTAFRAEARYLEGRFTFYSVRKLVNDGWLPAQYFFQERPDESH